MLEIITNLISWLSQDSDLVPLVEMAFDILIN